MSNKDIIKDAFKGVEPSEELINRTLRQRAAYPRRRVSAKRAVTIAIAVCAVLFCGISVYAFQIGWLSDIFGDSADVLYGSGKDYSALLENVVITCDNPNYEFEYVTADAVGEYLFTEFIVRRKDGMPIYPAPPIGESGSDGLTGGSGRSEKDGGLQYITHSSSAVGETDDGGIVLCNTVIKPDGVQGGEHITLEYGDLYIKDDGTPLCNSGDDMRLGSSFGRAYVPMKTTIEFDIAKTPLKDRTVREVNKTALFASGFVYEGIVYEGDFSCKIKSFSLSPISLQITAEGLETGDEMRLNDSGVIYRDGSEEPVAGLVMDDYSGTLGFTFGKFTDVDDIAAVRIGNLIIELD